MSDDEDAFAVFAQPVTAAPSATIVEKFRDTITHDSPGAECNVPHSTVSTPCNSADALTRTLLQQPHIRSSSSSGDGNGNASAGSAAGFVVVHGGGGAGGDTGEEQAEPRRRVIDPQRVFEEPHSGIRVRRGTRSLEQLSVWLAQCPYIPFTRLRALLMQRRQHDPSYTVEQTCIGVVTRKTEPKAGNRSAHAVLTVWDMTGLSPVANEELSFLLCGSAFVSLYTRLVVGTVVAVSNLSLLPPLPNQPPTTTAASSSFLLRLHDMEQVRVLGLAADLATCAAVSRRSGEQCHNLVNARRSRTCSYHIADLRRVARGHGGSDSRGQTSSQRITHLAPQTTARHPISAAKGSNIAPTTQPRPPRQTGFLAVNGATGLPVQTATSAHASNETMTGAGVYEGVYRGAALAIQPRLQVSPGLALHATANVAQGARTSAGQGGGVTTPDVMRRATRGRDTLLAAQRQQAAEEQRKLLASALHKTADDTSTRKRVRAEPTPTPPTTSADQLVAAVKAQCRPLAYSAGSARRPLLSSLPFGSLARRTDANCTAANRRVERAQLSQAAAASVLVRQVTAALAAESTATAGDAEAWQSTARSTAVTGDKHTTTCGTQNTTPGKENATTTTESLTLLGALADKLQSAQDHLRIAHEAHRVDAFLDRQSTQEKAIEALQSITEQTVRAVYCYQCQTWYLRAPDSCTAAQHHTELRNATKRYIQCEHCGYKTFVIGDHVKPWRVLPHCPRCNARCVWNASNAAPEFATAPAADTIEAPHPY